MIDIYETVHVTSHVTYIIHAGSLEGYRQFCLYALRTVIATVT